MQTLKSIFLSGTIICSLTETGTFYLNIYRCFENFVTKLFSCDDESLGGFQCIKEKNKGCPNVNLNPA